MNIMILDDNEEILEILEHHLSNEGYEVYKATCLKEAYDIFNAYNLDLIILDIMLKNESGYDFCETIRKKSMVPILFLTAKSKEEDIVQGLICGGDDYMVKPFSKKELLARIFAISRRQSHEKKCAMTIKRMIIDTNINSVMVGDQALQLTDIEFKTLLYLVKNRGSSVGVQEIFENVWDEKFISSSHNTVVVHIKNLRKKIHRIDSDYEYIKTVWGKGYIVY